MRGLFGDDGDRLDARRSGADDADALAGEIHALMRPLPGMIAFAAKRLASLEVRDLRRGEAPDRGDEVGGRQPVAPVGLDHPFAAGLVIAGTGHAGAELDVAPQVELVGDIIQIPQDLRLPGIAARPLPFEQDLLREGEAVVVAFGITARAGVAVPEPGAAHAVGHLDHPGAEAKLAQLEQHVEAGEPGTDDHCVVVVRDRDVRVWHGRASNIFRCGLCAPKCRLAVRAPSWPPPRRRGRA